MLTLVDAPDSPTPTTPHTSQGLLTRGLLLCHSSRHSHCPALPYRTLPCPVSPYPTPLCSSLPSLSCSFFSYPILPFSCPALPCHSLPCSSLPSPSCSFFLPYPDMPNPTLPFPVSPYPILLFPALFLLVLSPALPSASVLSPRSLPLLLATALL